MNADVEKAVAILDGLCLIGSEREAIKQALRDQDAEIARLQNVADTNAELYQHELLRTQKTDALLRDASRYLDPRHYSEINARITAHLGAKHG